MNPIQQIKSLLNIEGAPKAGMVAFKPGQLVYGKAEKFLPGQKAVIQIGNSKVIADLKTPLTAGRGYWFEVAANPGGGIELKAAAVNGQESIARSPLSLLKDFHLPETKNNVQLLEYFLDKSLPFTKGELVQAAHWTTNQHDLTKALTALEFMIKKGLPFTIKTYQALLAAQDSSSFSSQLEGLSSFLGNEKFASFNSVPPLQQLLASIIGERSVPPYITGEKIKEMIKSRIQTLGLDFEKEVTSKDKVLFKSLKPLLMSAINELGTEGKSLEPVLDRLTGIQLISRDIASPVQQMIMQLPLSFGEQTTDATIHWSGRKTGDGQIDPDYCRIIFYLELESLSLTMVDMQVQNRVVHLSIKNDSMNMGPVVAALTPLLREKLESLRYKLSFINILPSDSNMGKESPGTQPSLMLKDMYEGVDIKV